MKFSLSVGLAFCMLAVCSSTTFVIPANSRHPGVCMYSGSFLQRGNNNSPTKCQNMYCNDDGSILVQTCGGQRDVTGCHVVDSTNLMKSYPECCKVTYICTTPTGEQIKRQFDENRSIDTTLDVESNKDTLWMGQNRNWNSWTDNQLVGHTQNSMNNVMSTSVNEDSMNEVDVQKRQTGDKTEKRSKKGGKQNKKSWMTNQMNDEEFLLQEISNKNSMVGENRKWESVMNQNSFDREAVLEQIMNQKNMVGGNHMWASMMTENTLKTILEQIQNKNFMVERTLMTHNVLTREILLDQNLVNEMLEQILNLDLLMTGDETIRHTMLTQNRINQNMINGLLNQDLTGDVFACNAVLNQNQMNNQMIVELLHRCLLKKSNVVTLGEMLDQQLINKEILGQLLNGGFLTTGGALVHGNMINQNQMNSMTEGNFGQEYTLVHGLVNLLNQYRNKNIVAGQNHILDAELVRSIITLIEQAHNTNNVLVGGTSSMLVKQVVNLMNQYRNQNWSVGTNMHANAMLIENMINLLEQNCNWDSMVGGHKQLNSLMASGPMIWNTMLDLKTPKNKNMWMTSNWLGQNRMNQEVLNQVLNQDSVLKRNRINNEVVGELVSRNAMMTGDVLTDDSYLGQNQIVNKLTGNALSHGQSGFMLGGVQNGQTMGTRNPMSNWWTQLGNLIRNKNTEMTDRVGMMRPWVGTGVNGERVVMVGDIRNF